LIAIFSQVIKRYSISTAIELLFLVHCILGDVDATLLCSVHSIDLNWISRTGDPLRPSALLMLASFWPLSRHLITSSFLSKVITYVSSYRIPMTYYFSLWAWWTFTKY
jgi:hypothetical protein